MSHLRRAGEDEHPSQGQSRDQGQIAMAQEWLGTFPICAQGLPPRLMEKFRILFYIILCFASLCLAYVEEILKSLNHNQGMPDRNSTALAQMF